MNCVQKRKRLQKGYSFMSGMNGRAAGFGVFSRERVTQAQSPSEGANYTAAFKAAAYYCQGNCCDETFLRYGSPG